MIATRDKSSLRPRPVATGSIDLRRDHRLEEQRRGAGYPLSRWYLRPLAGRLAAMLAGTWVRPWHLTACGLAVGLHAAAILLWQPGWAPAAAVLVLVAWLFDRADGQLARRQQTVSAWGAWLDANVDELLDLAWHVAVAGALARQWGGCGPWLLVLGFVTGKYLFMHGLATEQACPWRMHPKEPETRSRAAGFLRSAYHLPANADMRVHLLVGALWTGWLATELAVIAGYYHVRWIARYVLVARRLGGSR